MENNDKRLRGLLQGVTLVLVFFLLSRTPVDADMWWHLRAGQDMLEQQRILLVDPYSFTRAGTAWVNAFWLSEIGMYLLYSVGGYFALALFVALTGALTFLIVYRRLSGNPFVNSSIVILAVFTAAPIWGPRPQIISFLRVAVLDRWLAEGKAAAPRRAWLPVLLFALWSNLHGGWIWGFLLLAAHIAGRLVEFIFEASRAKQALIWREIKGVSGWSLLAGLAVGLNPNGPAIWKLPFQQVSVSLQIQEWLSPDFHRLDFHPLLWMIFLLMITAAVVRRSPDWPQLIKVIGFAYLTFVAQRNIALFAIVAAPLLVEWMTPALETLWDRSIKTRAARVPELDPRLTTVMNAVILTVLAVAAVGKLFLISRPAQVYEHYPVAAVEWIRSNRPNGYLFNSYNWGGFLLWKLPGYPVFIDGRADLYGSKLIDQWHAVVRGQENASGILDEWQINTVLLEPDWPIARILPAWGWQIAYQDDQSVILLR